MAKQAQNGIFVRLTAFEGAGRLGPRAGGPVMEFHVRESLRAELKLDDTLFSVSGNVILPNFYASRALAHSLNARPGARAHPERSVKAGRLNAMGLIDEILHYVCGLFRGSVAPDAFSRALAELESDPGAREMDKLLFTFTRDFPPGAVYRASRPNALGWTERRMGFRTR
jgi:hypothetical protein